MLAFETEDVLQAWALPMENIIGVGGFVLALAANPLTSGLGREGLLWRYEASWIHYYDQTFLHIESAIDLIVSSNQEVSYFRLFEYQWFVVNH